jgi:hypothetical protein
VVQHISSVVATLDVGRLWMDGIRQRIALPALLRNRGRGMSERTNWPTFAKSDG